MIYKAWRRAYQFLQKRICPTCISQKSESAETLELMRENSGFVRLLRREIADMRLSMELDSKQSGHAARDMLADSYGGEPT